ncbi:MAG: hypothetical protein CVU18_08340 [Betaproteobacteria bacterium HGW-Betaproteobacteria-12]|nr:MAG: hypothetical protein CVU18_08340 [Betaproteobacteria bacterium HGW-Betaproteobacteria-12]
MLAALIVGAVRQAWWQSFKALPPLATASTLPANASHLRFSLLRSLKQLRRMTLYQLGGTEFSECYILGHNVVQPALASILIKNGWVVPGAKHWVKEIIKFQLSSAGLAVEQQLEAWWATLTLDQRLRAALLE